VSASSSNRNFKGRQGSPAGRTLLMSPAMVALAALEGRESLTSLPLSAGRTVRLLTHPIQAGGRVVGVLQVGETLDAVAATLGEVRDILLVGSLAVLAVAVSGGLLLGARALAPIRRVSATAARIAATGDYGQRLPAPRSRDEVGELVATFNALIQRVESSLEEQRRFLADTSHELRSPLTVIRANLGFLWRETDPETRADCLRESETEALRMTCLVSGLLLLGQAEAGELLVSGRVDLAELLAEIAEQARAQSGGREVVIVARAPVTATGDRDRLRQLLWNLVENALRYTPPNGVIRLDLERENRYAVVRVADTGPGIPTEHLPRVFDRFYRVDRARSRATGGSGLGLAIVKHIAQAHGGTVAVDSQADRGTTFTVRLPAEPPVAPALPPASTRPLAIAAAMRTEE